MPASLISNTSNMIMRWLLPPSYQQNTTRVFSDQLAQVCFEITTDGFTTQFNINHKMGITAADLLAGWPLVEITNPATNPITPSSGATRTVLTGTPALLGVTVLASLTNDLILAFATPNAAPGAVFQVLLTRNPASVIAS
jgi:hypothetical protein